MLHRPGKKPSPNALDLCPSYRPLAEKLKASGRTVAAPSFVIPGTVTDNCRYLEGLFPEIGLVLFETRACLEYGHKDLAPDLPDLDLGYHVHLPLDLPWSSGPEQAVHAALALVQKTAYLVPRAFVLHPPREDADLRQFVTHWEAQAMDPGMLLLENIAGNGLRRHMDTIRAAGLGLCLDLGHAMAYDQPFPAKDGDWDRVRMLHIYAPGQGDRHTSLDSLNGTGRQRLRELVDNTALQTTITLEVFEEAGLVSSAEKLLEWLDQWETL